MLKQAKDLKPGDNLYIIDGYELSIAKILDIRKFLQDCLKINWGISDMNIVDKDCTSFSYGDKLIFLNKENAISCLEGFIDK